MREIHPTSFELEASHAERCAGTFETHLAGCACCRSLLESLDRERSAFLAARPAADFVRHIRQRVEGEKRRSAGAGWWPLLLVPIATLLVVFQLVRTWPPSGGSGARVEAARQPGPEASAHGWTSPETALPTSATTGSPELAMKGASGPALIVRREESQFLAHRAVTIRPDDELRLRFSLPQAGDVEAGILMATGEWVHFFSGHFSVGEHVPEATLRVDREPSAGTLLLGAPAEVTRARAGLPAAVQTISIAWRPLQ
jgi:hypothetical protein